MATLTFFSFRTCVLSAIVCLLFLLVSLVGCITKTCLYNFDPFKSHFYIVKLGFTEVYIIFLITAQNIDCGYPLEQPLRSGSNEYPQSMFWAEIWKYQRWAEIWKYQRFLLCENFQFLEVKLSVYLNRRLFVMVFGDCDCSKTTFLLQSNFNGPNIFCTSETCSRHG